MSWMITVEAVLISVFGALLGMVLGTALGITLVKIFGGQYLKLTRMIAYEQASGHSLRSPWGSTRGQRTGDHSDHRPTFEPGSRGTVNP